MAGPGEAGVGLGPTGKEMAMASEHPSSEPEGDTDEGSGMTSQAVNKAEAGLILSGPGGRPITDDVPDAARTEPHRLEDAASHDETGQAEKR